MISVSEAEQIILSQTKDYGTESVPFEQAMGRVLAEEIKTDRDLPPCNRVTMDGIAISFAAFEAGIRSFSIKGTIAAGNVPIEVENSDECVEIMTGAALPDTTDTVVRYEDVDIKGNIAILVTDAVIKGQNIHKKGKDKKQGETVATARRYIDATVISMAASVGRDALLVKKLPRVLIVSTGDELVDVAAIPTPYQVRHSNNHTLKAVLQQYCIHADLLHLPDEPGVTKEKIEQCLRDYEVIILCGGVSMGKFDYVPTALEQLGVTKHFHKVRQRPGKPFWFGTHAGGARVFAFPGNPVSAFMCLHRYFIPWLEKSSDLEERPGFFAVLARDITFTAPIQYFAQVKLNVSRQGRLFATPVEGNGSGDFANLLDSDAFMELPQEQSNFMKGEVYRIWPFKKIL